MARQIIEWSRSHLPRFAFGKGATYGSLTPALDHGGHSYFPFYMGTDGRINIQFQWMNAMPPFDQVAMREEFLRRLNEVPGVQLPSDAIERRPGLPLKLFATPESLAALLASFEWFLSQAQLEVG